MEKLIMHDFYTNKRVFITGHTGFKGTWLTYLLHLMGADITGYSLDVPTNPSLFEITGLDKNINHIIGDIRDLDQLKKSFDAAKPEIVLHLAAQPIVRESYVNPVYTYETNVMGTLNLLECVRLAQNPPKSVLNITTDKVYMNREWEWGYREDDPLNGYDPYSNSKSCSELVTHSYKNSFLDNMGVAVSTARAGNVIGGGDFSADRIIPDCVRAMQLGIPVSVRNPDSTRPYQHVLDPIFAYLMIAAKQYFDISLAGCYNIGPDDSDCLSTGDLVELFCEMWGNADWVIQSNNGPHEANFLKLDCSRAKKVFDWEPVWRIGKSMLATVEWTKAYLANEDINAIMRQQIEDFKKEACFDV